MMKKFEAATDESKIEQLRLFIIEGINSGKPVSWNIDEFLEEMHLLSVSDQYD